MQIRFSSSSASPLTLSLLLITVPKRITTIQEDNPSSSCGSVCAWKQNLPHDNCLYFLLGRAFSPFSDVTILLSYVFYSVLILVSLFLSNQKKHATYVTCHFLTYAIYLHFLSEQLFFFSATIGTEYSLFCQFRATIRTNSFLWNNFYLRTTSGTKTITL